MIHGDVQRRGRAAPHHEPVRGRPAPLPFERAKSELAQLFRAQRGDPAVEAIIAATLRVMASLREGPK